MQEREHNDGHLHWRLLNNSERMSELDMFK